MVTPNPPRPTRIGVEVVAGVGLHADAVARVHADGVGRHVFDRLFRTALGLGAADVVLGEQPSGVVVVEVLTAAAGVGSRVKVGRKLEYEQWHDFLGHKEMVAALLDRLRHRCHTIRIEGPSLRSPH